jgi:transglutaminase/protease-like cytokinesis protein 3
MWIAIWIKYDKTAKALALRKPITTLTNGYKVCHGYAELFNAMFNSVTVEVPIGSGVSESTKSRYIGGWAKQKVTDTKREGGISHAWNYFPIFDVNGKFSYNMVRDILPSSTQLTALVNRLYIGRW